MKRYVTLKEIIENDELFDCVLRKIGFYYFLNYPNEYIRLNNLSLKNLHKPLECHTPVTSPKYRIIIEE